MINVYSPARSAVTRHQTLCVLNNRNLFFHIFCENIKVCSRLRYRQCWSLLNPAVQNLFCSSLLASSDLLAIFEIS